MRDDTLRRVWSTLRSLRDNAPETFVGVEYVADLHKALDLLEALGHNTSGWRIPPGQMPRRPGTGETLDSPGGRYVAGKYFRMKLDAVLGFFSIQDRPIGFKPPSQD